MKAITTNRRELIPPALIKLAGLLAFVAMPSLAEAARALRAAGWPVAGAAVLAATPRRRARGRAAA